MKTLLNQVALITGGSSGIGLAIALKFAEEGATVILIGTNGLKGEAALKEIKEKTGQTAHFYAADVGKTEKVDEIIKKVLEAFGQIDILINNAGITADQLLMRMTEEEWDRVLDTNLKSCYNLCHALVRPMMKAKKGKIINIASVVGLTGNSGQTNYAASKAGMIGFTKALAQEVATRGIQVNAVAPGFIATLMTEQLNEEQRTAITKTIPMGYMGTPADVANVVWFLACPLSNYITGQVITVDGGMVM
jgi:3-oxoacyl-[acyl-carrier protein] reductase